MFRNSYQHGAFCIFHSGGAKPFELWDVKVQDGYLERYLDQDLKKMVIEIGGTNVSTTYMTCPKGKKVLGIGMPFLIMTVKNLKKYFTFEVTILDSTNTRRRFRVANFQSTTQIFPFCTAMPICLADGWNQIQFNLAEFTNRAYKREYLETQNIKVNASIRIRQIYFSERLLSEEELPPQLQLHLPLPAKRKSQTIALASAPKPSLEKVNKSDTQVEKTSNTSASSVTKIKQTTDDDQKSFKDKIVSDSEKRPKTHWSNRKTTTSSKKTSERRASETLVSEYTKYNEGLESATKDSIESIQETIDKQKIVIEIVEELVLTNVIKDVADEDNNEPDVAKEEEGLLKVETNSKTDNVSVTDEKENVDPPNEDHDDSVDD